jgi:Metallo-peptidase family M12B Reprolysin-like/Putative Ig domain
MRGLILLVAGVALALPATATAQVWEPVPGTPPATHAGAPAVVQPERFRAFTLDRPELEARLAAAPLQRAQSAPQVLSLPAPGGGFERFAVEESPIMEPELARRHPDITTYGGRGIDDPAATIRADVGPLGFHASVRSPQGAWYIDPYYHLDQSLYVSYFGRDLEESPHGTFVEREPLGETDPLELGAAIEQPTVTLRTYRLALLTDPTYATFFGGPANVTAAKVVLMNRVNQIYEDETAIRLVLIGDNDLLNLDTAAQMTGVNGPCGAAACYTQQQATSCGGATLARTRIVIGQIIGASDFDIGHIALGNPGGGVASLGVVGGNNKAQGCTGLSTPVGDFFAVDYVAHEMGHQFAGNHTFNGTQSNCSGGNRSAANSVEPGSGSSIMAYAGICQQDNLQPHSDPYWSQRSFAEITTYVTSERPPINEVQTVSLRDFDADGDAFTIEIGGEETAPIVRGANYTPAAIQNAIQGVSEVQTVSLEGYDTDGDSFRLGFGGGETIPIVRGANNTPAGIQNAIQGGNEQQQVTLTGFDMATQSFQVQIGDATSAVLGFGGLPVTNGNVAAAINAIPGFAGTVGSTGAGNAGFTLTFGGASAGTDVPPISIVNCTCTSAVREIAQGGGPMTGWPAGATVVSGPVTDAGFTLTLSGTLQGTDVAPFTVTGGTVAETAKGTAALLPPGSTGTVAAFGGTGELTDAGFQISFGAGLAGIDLEPVGLAIEGASGFVGETARGGPIDNRGHTITDTGNHAPVVTAPAAHTIPTRTPFALTGSATDADGDTVTYMWEQNDRGGIFGGSTAGTALVSNVKTNGPLFRQFGVAANVTPEGTLQSPSPGLNAVTTDPTRVFPDMAQIAAGKTNAATGTCPPAPPPPTAVPPDIRDCFSEFLPTAAYVGFFGDHTLNFRLTARDGNPGAGGLGSADTRVTVAPEAGPFLVTSQAEAATVSGGSTQTVTWNVAGTDQAPVSTGQVRISLSLDGGFTYPHVLAAVTANDGSAPVTLPNVATAKARIKVEAVGNVFFDISDADLVIGAVPVVGATDRTVQYSDAVGGVVVEARDEDSAGAALTATATGLPAGLALAVASTSEESVRPGTRTWTLAGNVTAAPGTYAATVTVSDGAGDAVTVPLRITVTPEDATATYAGETLAFSGFRPELRATVREADDGAPGDLRNATVTFREGSRTLCAAAPSAACSASLGTGTHSIDIVIGGRYAGGGTATVRIVRADDAEVDGRGDIVIGTSAGSYRADAGSRLEFDLDARYRERRDDLDGDVEIELRSGGRSYEIDGDNLESIGVAGDRAELRAEADLEDSRGRVVERDATLYVAVTDDTIAVSLWDGGELLVSTPARTLREGRIRIR